MGIINVTPDSFSDGCELHKVGAKKFQVDLDRALYRAETMAREGATFIDVGGESTRPGAAVVAVQEEIDRVVPLIQALHKRLDVCISVDTSSPQLMAEAINGGAELVNDIRALSRQGALQAVCKTKAAVCLMHMQGEPNTMQDFVSYERVVDEVFGFLSTRVESCLAQGFEQSRLLIDPGFGFGKSVQQNYQLLKNLARFSDLEVPLLVGLSRKSMIGEIIKRPVHQRLAGSIAATTHALHSGAKIIRTHDVAATMDAIRVNSAYANAE